MHVGSHLHGGIGNAIRGIAEQVPVSAAGEYRIDRPSIRAKRGVLRPVARAGFEVVQPKGGDREARRARSRILERGAAARLRVRHLDRFQRRAHRRAVGGGDPRDANEIGARLA